MDDKIMKKRYYLLIYVILLFFALWIFYFSGWEEIVIILITINIIAYASRKPLNALAAFVFKSRRRYRVLISLTINIIWIFFLFWLLLTLSAELFIAIISFLIVAISLNFRNVVNNIASGILLLTTEQFEVGDLIETNSIQGIVKEINLNYVKIREFDGVDVILPNSNAYGSPIIKFSHSKFKIFKPKERNEFERKKYYRQYLKTIKRIISAKIKTTKYVKQVEILGTTNPEDLALLISNVFDQYEPIFGLRPDYSIDTTRYGRVRISLYIMSEKPMIVINFIDAFLRDLVYELYSGDIYLDWKKNPRTPPERKTKREREDK